MKKRKVIGKSYRTYIVLGFTLMYLVSMLLATYLMKDKYIETYQREAGDIIKSITSQIEAYDMPGDGQSLTESDASLLSFILSDKICYSGQYSMLSAAIMDKSGTIIAQSGNVFRISSSQLDSDGNLIAHRYITYNFHDYFEKEDQGIIIDSYQKEQEHIADINSSLYQDTPLSISEYNEYYKNPYKCLANFDDNGNLMTFEIRDVKTNQFTEDVIYAWKNPDIISGTLYYNQQSYGELNQYFALPYCKYGDDLWARWNKDTYIHAFEKKKETELAYSRWYVPVETGTNTYKYLNNLTFDNYHTKEDCYTLQVNQHIYPWHAAVDYMKFIYLFGGLFVIVCTLIVLYFSDRYYKKHSKLDQMRQDFTNAAAHELKTPLGIVRGLAEVMDESKSEEKKSAYRAEIVKQTEAMDDLVKEMLFVSKLDSNNMSLSKETISILSVIEEVLQKLEYHIKEKNLQIQYEIEKDFVIKGNKSLFEKAIFNILENAVAYNKIDGRILIHTESDQCIIENTADPISEEDLPHVCDMFFTGNKSRNKEQNHKGLGLYLVKRIFEMHKIELKVENGDAGVRTVFYIK